MSSGHPDWGQGQQTSIIASIPDAGENAARLGAVAIQHRTGNVFFEDRFEGNGNAWMVDAAPGGSSADVSTVYPFTGIQSYRIAGSSGSVGEVIAVRFLPVVSTGKFGCEFMINSQQHPSEIRIRLQVTFAGVVTFIGVRFTPLDGKGFIITDTTAFVEVFDDILILDPGSSWFNVKFVYDFDTQQYTKFIINSQVFTIPTHTMIIGAGGSPDGIILELRSNSELGDADVVNFDNLILTVNEP